MTSQAVQKHIAQLEKAVALQETLRNTLGDAMVEAAITPLRQQIREMKNRLKNDSNPDTISELGTIVEILERDEIDIHGLPDYVNINKALQGERKLVTVLYADISGFTAMSETMDPEKVRDLMNTCFEELGPIVTNYGGLIDKFIGDSIMALFGAPMAHENDPERAIRAALEMSETLANFKPAQDLNLGVHFGINTGLVIAGGIGTRGKQEYSVMGDTVNMASRLVDLSERGQILVGPDTFRQSNRIFEFQEIRSIRVKGKTEPMTVYRVLGFRTQQEAAIDLEARGISSPLVGRDDELKTLTVALENLLEGRGGIISIIGEAGLGKSRLIAEAKNEMAGKNLTCLEGRTLSFTNSISYWPFHEIIKNYIGFNEKDDERTIWSKLRSRVTALFPAQEGEILPYLASLLSLEVKGEFEERVKYLDGEDMRRQIFLSARRFFEALARERPLVLIFEDLQWADQSSMELLKHLLPLVETTPLLFCCVNRPDPHTPAAQLREILYHNFSHRYLEIILTPLSQTTSAQLIDNILEIDEHSLPLRELILSKTEGNPFFVEEVIRSLIDMGALMRDNGTRRWRASSQMAEITIPETIHGVIMARIDRLNEDVKEVLKAATVIGRSFFYRILRKITDLEWELDKHLDELQQLELIREKTLNPELEYIFKHTLVQEAAYKSILLQKRKNLHRKVGQSIEVLFADRLEEFYGFLAYHYTCAEEWEKAQDYLFKVGDQAGKLAADAEALSHYEQALAAYTRVFGEKWDPFQRAVLERKVGEALFRRGDHQQSMEYLQRALAYLKCPFPTSLWDVRLAIATQLVRQLGHRFLPWMVLRKIPESLPPMVEEKSRIHGVMGWIDYFSNPERLLLHALVELNFNERCGFSLGRVRGSMGMGLICDQLSFFRLAKKYHHQAVTLAEQLQHPIALGYAYFGFAFHRFYLGMWIRALDLLRRSAEAYWDAGHLRGWGAATAVISKVFYWQGDFTNSLSLSQESVRLGQDGADPQVLGWGLLGLGRVQSCQRSFQEAESNLLKALELFKTLSDYQTMLDTMGDLGQCYLSQGKLEEALIILEQSKQMILERNLRGHTVSSTRNGLAEAYLMAAEKTSGHEKIQAMRKAKWACLSALKQGKSVRGGLPQSMRLRGTYAWMRDKKPIAWKWWKQSLALAEELGERYELGKTHLEIYRHTKDDGHFEQAKNIFGKIGLNKITLKV